MKSISIHDFDDGSSPLHCSIVGAILGGAGISGIASLIGGSKASNAAIQAAQIQAQAAEKAIAFQQGVFDTTQANIAPFMQFGQRAIPTLEGAIPGLAAPIDTTLPQWQPTQAQLESTPGYQFTLSQGLKAAQNQLTASGLGRGGPSERAATNYASGLASTTYQQQFGNYLATTQNLMASRAQELQQRGQIYNMLAGPVSTGLSAAAAGAGAAVPLSNQIASSIQNVGAAQASGVVGSANALNQGFAGLGGAASNAATLLAVTGMNPAAQAAPAINTSADIPFNVYP